MLNKAMRVEPILGYADYNQPFVVETDASNDGLGAVVSQVQDGKSKVIAYVSRGLRGGEKSMDNYSSKKLELLALKWPLLRSYRTICTARTSLSIRTTTHLSTC